MPNGKSAAIRWTVTRPLSGDTRKRQAPAKQFAVAPAPDVGGRVVGGAIGSLRQTTARG
jgi:hypothetical protein